MKVLVLSILISLCKSFDGIMPSSVLFLHGKSNDGPSFRTKMKTFRDQFEGGSTLTFLTSPFRGEWWELPPGVRSGDADLYKGYEESESSVLAAIATHKPNALLGQSQGAILLFSMLIRGVLKDYQGSIILNGIQYPKPFDVLIDELLAKGDKMFTGGRVLLVVGSNDDISPPAGAMRCLSVLKVLCDEVEVCEHEGGHSVPIHDENASRIMLQYCLR